MFRRETGGDTAKAGDKRRQAMRSEARAAPVPQLRNEARAALLEVMRAQAGDRRRQRRCLGGRQAETGDDPVPHL